MVKQRDRDLGQTFLTGEAGYEIESLFLRIGFADKAVLSGAPHAEVALQFFEVSGSPRLNDSGTPGWLGQFDRLRSPELDDYLEGESYRPIGLLGGRLPLVLRPGDYLRFAFPVDHSIRLRAHGHYAFLLMFCERAKDRSMTLANSYAGGYTPDPSNRWLGHGIRREGWTGPAEEPYFSPYFPDDFDARLAHPPGTLGFPDVDTFRDLFFIVTARAAEAEENQP
jgi:hypothetical protein